MTSTTLAADRPVDTPLTAGELLFGAGSQPAGKTASPLRVARRKVEKLIEAAPSLSSLAVVQRIRALDHLLALKADALDQRLRIVQGEPRFPRAARAIGPTDHRRLSVASRRNRAGLHP